LNAVCGYYRINKLYTANIKFPGCLKSGSSDICIIKGKNTDGLKSLAKMQAIAYNRLSYIFPYFREGFSIIIYLEIIKTNLKIIDIINFLRLKKN